MIEVNNNPFLEVDKVELHRHSPNMPQLDLKSRLDQPRDIARRRKYGKSEPQRDAYFTRINNEPAAQIELWPNGVPANCAMGCAGFSVAMMG